MGKRRILFFLFIIFVALFFCGCGKQEKALPKLIIGCDNYRPYSYTDEDGEAAGMDVELAKEACRRMGYTPVFRRIDWNKRDDLLASREIDCLWSCFSMEGQEERYAWVGPYMYSRQVVAVLENSSIYHLKDLKGKKVAVRVSSDAEDIFLQQTDERIPSVQKVYCMNDLSEVVTALRNNYVEACAGHAAAIREQLENAGVSYRFLEENLVRTGLGVAFSKESDAALRQKLAAALEEMQADGTTARILEGYGVDVDKVLGGEENE